MASQQQSTNGASGKLWGGRFTGQCHRRIVVLWLVPDSPLLGATDPLMVKYNESIYFDRAFYAQDIAGSVAFARANVKTRILTQAEFETIEKGFRQVLEEWQTISFDIRPGVDEDIHTANERRLGEIIGTQIAGKLHTYA